MKRFYRWNEVKEKNFSWLKHTHTHTHTHTHNFVSWYKHEKSTGLLRQLELCHYGGCYTFPEIWLYPWLTESRVFVFNGPSQFLSLSSLEFYLIAHWYSNTPVKILRVFKIHVEQKQRHEPVHQILITPNCHFTHLCYCLVPKSNL